MEKRPTAVLHAFAVAIIISVGLPYLASCQRLQSDSRYFLGHYPDSDERLPNRYRDVVRLSNPFAGRERYPQLAPAAPQRYASLRLSPDDFYVLPSSQWTDALSQGAGAPSRGESQSDEYAYDYDNDWVPLYGTYTDDWYAPEAEAPGLESEGREADLYSDLLVNYILKGWQRQQNDPSEVMAVQRRNDKVQNSTKEPESKAKEQSTEPPTTGPTTTSTSTSSSPSINDPLERLSERRPVFVVDRGQKEFPILRPSKDNRQSPPTSWLTVEEQLSRAKNSFGAWKSSNPLIQKLKSDSSAQDSLISQLDSLKSRKL